MKAPNTLAELCLLAEQYGISRLKMEGDTLSEVEFGVTGFASVTTEDEDEEPKPNGYESALTRAASASRKRGQA
jgi:hypothetical protein